MKFSNLGFLNTPSLNLLLGPFGSRKTWLGLDLAVSVAAGSAWLGTPTSQSPVLFIDNALGIYELRQRLGQVLRAYNASPDLPLHFAEFGLTKPAAIQTLLAESRSLKPGLIIIDSPFGWRPYLTQADFHAIHPLLAGFRQLADVANAAVLLIHDLAGSRTSRASLFAASGIDHVLIATSSRHTVHLRTLFSSSPPISILADFFRGHFRLSIQPALPTLGSATQQILRHLSHLGSATTAQLQAACSAAVATRVRSLIAELVYDGYLYRSNPGGKGTPAQYRLTLAGERLV